MADLGVIELSLKPHSLLRWVLSTPINGSDGNAEVDPDKIRAILQCILHTVASSMPQVAEPAKFVDLLLKLGTDRSTLSLPKLHEFIDHCGCNISTLKTGTLAEQHRCFIQKKFPRKDSRRQDERNNFLFPSHSNHSFSSFSRVANCTKQPIGI
jgi:hypothetical protein